MTGIPVNAVGAGQQRRVPLQERLDQALIAGILAFEQCLPARREELLVRVLVWTARGCPLVVSEVAGEMTDERDTETAHEGMIRGLGHQRRLPRSRCAYPARREGPFAASWRGHGNPVVGHLPGRDDGAVVRNAQRCRRGKRSSG